MTTRNWLLFGLVFLFISAALFLVYMPGLGGQFYLDAHTSLLGMRHASALEYIFSGASGPGGRPIALASFLLTPDAWPDNPYPMRAINLAIHIINGVLVFWLSTKLARLLGLEQRVYVISAIIAIIWLIHPLNSTVVLLVVQRMTGLSAMFMLAGIICYLYGRSFMRTDYRHAYWYMTLGIVLGTTLAVFSKENGILLPLLILIIEYVLLKHYVPIQNQSYWKSWSAIFLFLPCVLVVAYVAFKWPQYYASFDTRPFSFYERIITQPRVLLEYIMQFLFPQQNTITPFHDDYSKSTDLLSPPVTVVALALWSMAIVVAVAFRKRVPLLSFAVAWFLGGHVLESTVLPLELYYEHRNYLPMLGPLIALVVAGSRQTVIDIKVMAGLAALLGGLHLVVLYGVSSTWGNPALAAELWNYQHPASVRTGQFLASKYLEQNDLHGGVKVLQKLYRQYPDSSMLPMQILKIKCTYEEVQDDQINELVNHLKSSTYEVSYETVLKKYFTMVRNEDCLGVDMADIYALIQSMLQNPQFQKRSNAVYNLNFMASQYAIFERDLSLAMYHVEKAREASPDFATIRIPVLLLMSGGLHEEAENQFSLIDEYMPVHPVKRYLWEKQRLELRDEMNRILGNSGNRDENTELDIFR